MSVRTSLCALVAASCFPSVAAAQPAQAESLTPEVFIGVGVAHPFRVEDRGFGSHLNIGGGAGLRWRRLGIEFEANRTLGLSPEVVSCGVVNPPCAGTARSGVLSANLASANVLYFFPSGSRPSAEFYLTGGVGALWSQEVTTMTVTGPAQATVSELVYNETGLAINVGAGVRMRVTESISIRPEFRFYNSVALSMANLSLTRFSIAAGYRW